MSLFGTLNTAVSGLTAQANYLGTIGDNLANSSTTGYKSANIDFETALGNQTPTSYTSGGVQTKTTYAISDQGPITSTTSVTDLAVSGSGFFVVQSPSGATALTRAGSFVPDASGNLVNTAGYSLMGYNLTDGSSATANGTGGLQVINLSKQALTANPSTSGSLVFNVDSASAVSTAPLPSVNQGGATPSAGTYKTSVQAFDDLGNAVTLDVYLTKTADSGGQATWKATTFNQADAAPGGGFPYTATPGSKTPLSDQTLVYSDTTGKLVSVDGSTSNLNLSVTIPNGQPLSLDISQSTQLSSASNVTSATINGSQPSKLDHVTIGTDGTVTSVYANGVQQATYRIPLADVPSETNMTPLAGNVYQPSLTSGNITVGTATTGSLGKIESDSLESSDVDLATQLTNMIAAQRSYEANSKVIQASSDLLTVVDQLKG